MTNDATAAMKAANAAYLEKATANRLRDIIIEALPYVEAQLDDPAYKKEAIRGMVNRMRKAVEE